MPNPECAERHPLHMGEHRIQLRLLGGFGLTVDGRDVVLTPSAQRLLAFIALTPRRVQRSFAAFQLWPEHDERRAKANLRSALWRLGKVTASGDDPVELIVASKADLRLASSVWVDCRQGVAEVASDGERSIVAAALPFEALDSDLLPDWYDDWLTIERERLRQFRLGSLEESAQQALKRGKSGQAIQLALNAASIEPLRESAHRLVIEAHLCEGNLADAQRQYQLYAGLLQAAFGHDPSPAITTLIEPVLAEAQRPRLVAV